MDRRSFLTLLSGTVAGAVLLPRFLTPSRSAMERIQEDGTLVHHATWAMGQILQVWIQDVPEDLAHEAINDAFRAVRDLESSLSRFDPTSELNALLEAPPGRTVAASPSLRGAFDAARRAGRTTAGRFDPTIREGEPAPGMDVFRSVDGVGIRRSSRLDSIDFGGMGCGLALDVAGERLMRRGVRRAMMEMSGDFLAFEAPIGFAGWPLAVADPWTGEPTEFEFDLAHQALATSSVVERSHILDPSTGAAADGIAQASVLASTALDADILSTASVVRLGPIPTGMLVAWGWDGGVLKTG